MPRNAMRTFLIIYATFPDRKTARRIVTALVNSRLAACGNIFKLDSIYAWQGRIESAAEHGALIKTRASLYKKVESFIKERHPYQVPEIICWEIKKGSKSYLDWIRDSTRPHAKI